MKVRLKWAQESGLGRSEVANVDNSEEFIHEREQRNRVVARREHGNEA